MKRIGFLISLLLALASTGRAEAQWGHLMVSMPSGGIRAVQGVALSCSSSATSCTATVPSTGAGHLLAVAVGYCGSNGCGESGPLISSITDTNGNTCTAVPGANTGPYGEELGEIWECPNNATGGNDNFTISFTTSVYYAFGIVEEISGAVISSPGEAGSGTTVGSPTTAASVSTDGATSVSGDLILSMIFPENVASVTAGQTVLASNPYFEYQIAGAPGPTLKNSSGGEIELAGAT